MACINHGEMRSAYKLWPEKRMKRMCVYGWIILKRILRT